MAKKPTDEKPETDNAETVDPAAAEAGAAGQAAAAGEQPQQQQQPITINAQYIKDLSFEAPHAPQIFGMLRDQQPNISVNIDVNATPMGETVYEVVIDAAATCKAQDQTAFILELSYAGLFTLNVPQEHLQPVLLIECPRLLFPFARNILAETSRDGGFPPLMLGPVDFVAMYQQQLQRQAAEQGGQGEAGASEG